MKDYWVEITTTETKVYRVKAHSEENARGKVFVGSGARLVLETSQTETQVTKKRPPAFGEKDEL